MTLVACQRFYQRLRCHTSGRISRSQMNKDSPTGRSSLTGPRTTFHLLRIVGSASHISTSATTQSIRRIITPILTRPMTRMAYRGLSLSFSTNCPRVLKLVPSHTSMPQTPGRSMTNRTSPATTTPPMENKAVRRRTTSISLFS